MIAQENDIQTSKHLIVASPCLQQEINLAQAPFANHGHFVKHNMLQLWAALSQQCKQFNKSTVSGNVLGLNILGGDFQQAVVCLASNVVCRNTSGGNCSGPITQCL